MDVTYETLANTYSKKSTDELLELHAAGHLTDLAYRVLEAALVERGITPPSRPVQPKDLRDKDPIPEYWRGNRSLARAFWLVGVLGGIAALIFKAVVTKPLAVLLGDALLANSIVHGLMSGYMFFALVSIWRCAKNSRKSQANKYKEKRQEIEKSAIEVIPAERECLICDSIVNGGVSPSNKKYTYRLFSGAYGFLCGFFVGVSFSGVVLNCQVP